MQFLDDYYAADADGNICVSDQQGSAFAKQIANDFNPIHDVGAKRFCVPGDLLFSIALRQYGLHQQMKFEFLDLVKSTVPLIYPDALSDGEATVTYENGKQVLAAEAAGDRLSDSAAECLLRQYVAFSGHNFPHILVPLMRQHNVMINPARPLVIYQSMSFELRVDAVSALEIRLQDTNLEVNGKRGDAVLKFSFYDGDEEVGHGAKNLVLSGLRPFDEQAIQRLCDDYMAVANAV